MSFVRPMRRLEAWRRVLFRILTVAAPLGLIALFFRSVDLKHSLRLIAGIGPRAFLLLGPFVLVMVFDTFAWRQLFTGKARRLSLGGLFAIRTALEAITFSLSSGALVADGLTPHLVRRYLGVVHSETIASVTTRKILLVLTQATVLAIGALLGFGFLASVSRRVLGVPGLPWLMLLVSLVMLTGGLLVLTTLMSGRAVFALHGLLKRIPSRRIREKLHRLEGDFMTTDRHLTRSSGVMRMRLMTPLMLYSIVWLLEGFESWLMLWSLGVDAGLVRVLAFVPAVMLLRQVLFFIPGGLGVQELGYLAFFRAAGLADPTSLAAAFSLLKRTREGIWIVAGMVVSGVMDFRLRASPETIG